MKKLLVILTLTFGLTYSVNSNAIEKIDLIFCASDMTKYFDPRYSEPYLKSTFGGKCPRSKPFEITYNQMSERVSSNYKLYLDSNKSVYFRSFNPGNHMREIKYDGRNFYVRGGTNKSNTSSFPTSNKSKSGFEWWYLLFIPAVVGLIGGTSKKKSLGTNLGLKKGSAAGNSYGIIIMVAFIAVCIILILKSNNF